MAVTAEFVDDSRWVVHVNAAAQDAAAAAAELREVVAEIAGDSDPGSAPVELWVREVSDPLDQVARNAGAVAYRDLWQLRCDLPVERSSITTRAFTPTDAEGLVTVNNRAFSWHPEQSGMTVAGLEAQMAEPWFDPDGLRLFERDGELLGFCWTKVHHDMNPLHGEIYVIAIDPSAHGQGLGTPMTLAGLDWIADRGIRHALLYVESDNDPANATYRKIGFVHHHTDRAYHLHVADAS